ncbi:MAG: peptidoglycan-binding domain-containing protein [Chthoniobacteraceae bacterium]
MLRISKSIALAVAALGILSLPAMADWHRGPGPGPGHGGHGYGRGHWGGGPRWSVGIGLGVPVYPGYYGPYYGSPYYGGPYYDEPYYDRPVVVGREVSGDVVGDAQRALARRGYYSGAVDGCAGPGTRAAIRAWQADCRLPITGRLDTPTLRSLALI